MDTQYSQPTTDITSRSTSPVPAPAEPGIIDSVCIHTERARAAADLLIVYFQQTKQRFTDVLKGTIETSLYTIIQKLDDIDDVLNRSFLIDEEGARCEVCMYIGHAHSTAKLLEFYFTEINRAAGDCSDAVEDSLEIVRRELDAIHPVLFPE